MAETAEDNANRAKFRRAFDAHFDALNRYCLRRIPLDDVNDVVSQIFMVAWRKIGRMPDEPDSLPWLYQVARHEINNARRSNRRSLALTLRVGGLADHPHPGPEIIVVHNEERSRVMNALSGLNPNDREILLLRTHEELDYRQISVALACSPEAARKRMARALRRLRSAAGIPGARWPESTDTQTPQEGEA